MSSTDLLSAELSVKEAPDYQRIVFSYKNDRHQCDDEEIREWGRLEDAA